MSILTLLGNFGRKLSRFKLRDIARLIARADQLGTLAAQGAPYRNAAQGPVDAGRLWSLQNEGNTVSAAELARYLHSGTVDEFIREHAGVDSVTGAGPDEHRRVRSALQMCRNAAHQRDEARDAYDRLLKQIAEPLLEIPAVRN